eukprot:3223420-Rhodomonas_salina.1
MVPFRTRHIPYRDSALTRLLQVPPPVTFGPQGPVEQGRDLGSSGRVLGDSVTMLSSAMVCDVWEVALTRGFERHGEEDVMYAVADVT